MKNDMRYMVGYHVSVYSSITSYLPLCVQAISHFSPISFPVPVEAEQTGVVQGRILSVPVRL